MAIDRTNITCVVRKKTPRQSMAALGLVAVLGMVLPGCESAQTLAEVFPTVADATGPWDPALPGSWTLSASLTTNSAWEIDAVFVRYQVHSWAGPENAIDAEATEVTGSTGTFAFTPQPPSGGFRRNDAINFQWFVEYRAADGGQDVGTAEAPLRRLLVGTTEAAETAALIADQMAVIAAFNITDPHVQFPIVPHGYVSLTGQGVPFANPAVAASLVPGGTTTSLAPGTPALLLYAPRPQGAGETTAQYEAAMTDQAPDPPYTLIGWAYGSLYDPGNRPVLSSIGSDHWFVHEAGWHTADGGILLCPPPEAELGASASALVPTLDCTLSPSNPLMVLPHPRVWDIHMWRNPAGPPTLSVSAPGPLPVGGPLPTGLTLPAASFFQPH